MAPTKLRQILVQVALYAALPIALVAAMLIGWMASVENATAVLQSADSPDGRYRAEVVREDPGVSAEYEYMVRLMPSGLSPLARSLRVVPFAPVYVALDAHREPDHLTVQWTSSDHLAIRCGGCGGSVAGKAQWRDIRLSYDVR